MATGDFVTVQHAAELAVLRMCLVSVLTRAMVDDREVCGLSVSISPDAFAPVMSIDVELQGQGGVPVGGFSL